MIWQRKEHIPPQKICSYLKEHTGETLTIEWTAGANLFTVTSEVNYSEAEFNMEVLHTLLVENLHGALVDEEKNAVEYAIGAIKTLVDMGVIK